MNYFKPNDLVLLTFRPTEFMPDGLVEMNDKKFYVAKPVLKGMAYELIGCVSRAGVPYTIAEDWLVPIKEGKRR